MGEKPKIFIDRNGCVEYNKGTFKHPNIANRAKARGAKMCIRDSLEGKPTMDVRYNPNGSVLAIEAITSPDGRVLGKMGHSERSGDNL